MFHATFRRAFMLLHHGILKLNIRSHSWWHIQLPQDGLLHSFLVFCSLLADYTASDVPL